MTCRQHILVQYDVGSQFIIYTLCLNPICHGQLGQISQLVAVGNLVRIFLRTGTACKRLSHIAHPYQWQVGIAVEGCRNGSTALRHRERPDVLANAGQHHRLARLVVDEFQTAVREQHALVRNHLHINGLACLGTTCRPAYVSAVKLARVFDAAAFAVDKGTTVQAEASSGEIYLLAYHGQTLDVRIVALGIDERLAQQLGKRLALHLLGSLACAIACRTVHSCVMVQLTCTSGIYSTSTVYSFQAYRVTVF